MKIVDLHVHSNKSDGSMSPSQLVGLAVEKGLCAFALTDHDTTEGIPEAMEAAREYNDTLAKGRIPALSSEQPERGTAIPGEQPEMETSVAGGQPGGMPPLPLEVIPGIEFSTEYQGKDIHILGLYIDYEAPFFKAQIQAFVDSRILRNRKMCANLQGAGIDISYEKLLSAYPGSVITRGHYARFMLEHGYVKSMPEAFEKYIGDHAKYYVPREKVTPFQAIHLILKAGGLPILAHPPLYHMSDEALDTLVGLLTEDGLAGIEAIYSTYQPSDERQMRSLAKKYGLCISGGSDFHGATKPNLEMATGYGSLRIPEDVLLGLKMRRKHSDGAFYFPHGVRPR